jgi:hypothetical protein
MHNQPIVVIQMNASPIIATTETPPFKINFHLPDPNISTSSSSSYSDISSPFQVKFNPIFKQKILFKHIIHGNK